MPVNKFKYNPYQQTGLTVKDAAANSGEVKYTKMASVWDSVNSLLYITKEFSTTVDIRSLNKSTLSIKSQHSEQWKALLL